MIRCLQVIPKTVDELKKEKTTPPPMYLKTYDLKNLGKFHIKLIETSLEAGERAA